MQRFRLNHRCRRSPSELIDLIQQLQLQMRSLAQVLLLLPSLLLLLLLTRTAWTLQYDSGRKMRSLLHLPFYI